MVDYAVQVSLHTTSNVPEDFCQNNWSFQATDLSGLQTALGQLIVFYNAISGLYSASVVQNGHTLKAYDRADPEPRAPVIDTTLDFTSAPAGATLPHDVAIVLSFQADPVSGFRQSSRRGRIYVGPLDQSIVDTNGRVSSSIRTTLANAADALATSSAAASTWTWGVWSQVHSELAAPLTNGWVDDSFDTQRRRGRVATARTVWVV